MLAAGGRPVNAATLPFDGKGTIAYSRCMRDVGDMKGPLATPVAPPPKPRADVARAPWGALVVPVCPKLLGREAREPMAALALFARALAEAVEGDGSADARLARVEALELALSGAFGPASSRPELLPAVILRDALLATGGSFHDALALADAAKDDIAGAVFADDATLLDHAARAAAPILRLCLHLHGVREEGVLARGDDLARAWYLLRRADEARSASLAEAALARAGDLAAVVEGRVPKAQLHWLRALAEAALAMKRDGAAGDALTAVSPWARARIRLAARLRAWAG